MIDRRSFIKAMGALLATSATGFDVFLRKTFVPKPKSKAATEDAFLGKTKGPYSFYLRVESEMGKVWTEFGECSASLEGEDQVFVYQCLTKEKFSVDGYAIVDERGRTVSKPAKGFQRLDKAARDTLTIRVILSPKDRDSDSEDANSKKEKA